MRRFSTWVAAALAATACPAAAQEPAVSRVTPVVRAFRKANPAVVNISTRKIVTARWGLLGRDIFEDIFPSPFRRQVPVQSLGSGFLVSPTGHVVTNAHVVRRAQQITVTLADESQHRARVISADPAHDLAVVKIEPPRGRTLPHLPLGRSDDLMVGETVIAIGNPLGYGHSVTRGIVSALGRKLEFAGGVTYDELIQTDAPINPGSSGGPLLNVRGELIGINTAIRADAQNIGFAIPVDALTREFPRLLDYERINRVIFGADVRQRHGKHCEELYVAEVRPGTPAAKTLKPGDAVLTLNGQPVQCIADFFCGMLASKAPETVRLKCSRGGKAFTAEVALKAKPRPDGKLLAKALFGVTLREITPRLARDLRLSVDSGLLAVGIDEGSPADRIGLKLKDVVFQIGTYYVKDLDTLGMILEDVEPGRAVRIGVARGGVVAWVSIRARRTPSGSAKPKPAPRPPAPARRSAV